MKIALMVAALCAASFIPVSRAWAQTPPTVLALGMSRDDALRAFGAPVRYSMGGHYYDNLPVMATGGALYSVYSRRTVHNEYEIWIEYAGDASASRLHPTLRIDEVRFLLDRATPMKQVMEDLPEVALACLPGCHILIDSRLGWFVWLSTNPDGDGAVVVGSMRDATTGKIVPIHAPDLTISEISVHTSHDGLRGIAQDTGKVWRPNSR